MSHIKIIYIISALLVQWLEFAVANGEARVRFSDSAIVVSAIIIIEYYILIHFQAHKQSVPMVEWLRRHTQVSRAQLIFIVVSKYSISSLVRI